MNTGRNNNWEAVTTIVTQERMPIIQPIIQTIKVQGKTPTR